ncbi:MAG: hypothetical protein SAK29_08720 [Scytonema sp. PMC 1069.18]|nr:hypothetical protein [Scytonema sp. PMC 1069.18]MEC4884568.1 hypothetical protein [Scytonema sp. PMC 1070.18]
MVKYVLVNNKSGRDIYVTIRTEKKYLVESQDKNSIQVDVSASIGIKALEASASTSVASSNENMRKYEWSPFIQAGECPIPNGGDHRFTLDTDRSVYYVTVRIGQVCPCMDVGYDIDTIDIDENGRPTVPGKVPIYSEQIIWLKHKSRNLYIVQPSKSNDWSKAASTPGKHMLMFGDRNNTIESGKEIWICNEKYRTNVYKTWNDWVAYAPADGNDTTQTWTIEKTALSTNSPGDTICFGDEVKFRNKNQSSYFLYTHQKDNEYYLSCHTPEEEFAKWIVEKPR